MAVGLVRPRFDHVRMLFRPRSWRREALFLGLCYIGYEWVRGVAPERRSIAFSNADGLQTLEQFLHIDIELSANTFLLDHLWLANAASAFYQLAHEGVAVAVLVWLWQRHRAHYAPLRSALVITTFVSLFTYWLIPLAPPRFAQAGIVDTMLEYPVLFAGMKSVTGLVNLYAAMPSVHVAWAVWCALSFSVASSLQRRWWVWCYPLTTALIVLGTGNHYVLDIIVGALLVGLAWWLVEVWHPDRRQFLAALAALPHPHRREHPKP